MGIAEILLIALGLSADAFAVSVCKGLSERRLTPRRYLSVGLWFGGFQALMPFIGYLLGSAFQKYIKAVDHWIAFVLLFLIGANMIRESLGKEATEYNSSFGFKTMLPMAIATSIDALAIGITFALSGLRIPILAAVGMIGCITFFLSGVGLKIGNVFGIKYKAKAEIAGGLILILLGVKILLEGLGVLPF